MKRLAHGLIGAVYTAVALFLVLVLVDTAAGQRQRTNNLRLPFTGIGNIDNAFDVIDEMLGGITGSYPADAGKVFDRGGAVYNVKNAIFGATGNGVTDDYAALQRVASVVNADCAAGRGATVLFPPGTYKIDQHRIDGGASANGITDIAWGPGCTGLHFIGYGARIEIKGDFNRAQDNGSNSFENAVIPFWIKSATNVTFEGFVVDGNSTEITEDNSSVLEGRSHCLLTGNFADGDSATAITNVTIKNAQFLNCQTDGIYIGNSNPIDRNVLIENVVIDGASRNGLTISQARGVTVRNSWILNTGTGTVNYDPRVGVDIEPNGCKTGSGLCSSGGAVLDDNTGEILFDNVQFYNNDASHFVAQLPYVEHVTIRHSTFVSGPDSLQEPIGLACNDCNLEDSYLYCNHDSARCHVISQSSSNTTNCKNRFTNNQIDTIGRGFWVVTQACDTQILRNHINFIGTGTLAFFVPTIQVPTGGRVVYEGNDDYIPIARHDGVTAHEAVKMEPSGGFLLARNNLYRTDTEGTPLWFTIDYAGSGVAQISHDCFTPTLNFRPVASSTYTAEDQCYSQGFTDEAFQVYAPTRTTVASNGAGTAAAFTITPDGVDGVGGSLHLITCNDTDGCAATLSETDIPAGATLIVVNLSANAVTVADSSGVQEVTGGSGISLAQWEVAAFIYTGDRWTEMFRN